MKTTHRAIGLLAISIVIAGTVVTPAVAAKRCRPFVPRAIPETASDTSGQALDAPVAVVTDRATESDPLVIEYEHDVSYGVPLLMSIEEDEKFFNFQVRTTRSDPGLHLRVDWPAPPHSDIDLYLHNEAGKQVAFSDAWNIPGVDDVSDQVFYEGHGGMGYEYIEGYRALNCGGYTLMSESGLSPGTNVTLRVWIGAQADHYDGD